MTIRKAIQGLRKVSNWAPWSSVVALAMTAMVAPGLGGCLADSDDGAAAVADPANVGGKADSYGGMWDPGWRVWQPIHKWTDIAPNGETWEEYYATWLQGIAYEDSGWRGENVQYTLADGTVVPAPSLECADTAMFLRFLYAQEFKLPMVMYGGNEVFGHFGWTDTQGNIKRSYTQYQLDAPRGSDVYLQGVNRYLPEDLQDYPHEDATIGEYLDAVLTNKRFGVFMQDLMNMYYSGNVAQRANTYYIQPSAIRAGDLQLHRSHPWEGIGHTITIQSVQLLNDKLLDVNLIQSYMPTHPWVSDGFSELTNYDPDPANLSGLQRWRRPVLRNGRWYLDSDPSVALPESEVETVPEQFEELFDVDPQEQVTALLSTINMARAGLYDNPNSCRRREDRETAFETLYELYRTTAELYEPLGFTAQPTLEEVRPEVDKLYRVIDDFIWGAMHYEASWVCHWNPSNVAVNNSMYDATVAYNQQVAMATTCQDIRIFRSENVSQYDGSDGFDDLATWAQANGYQWDGYSLDPGEGDEGGALRSVVTDELADPNMVDYFCSIAADLEYWAH
ncbi:MAG: hypothetical protein JRI23_06295 [Deltaproteobacteria bacterium]|jgi:hypothetical protein|nr:hypothetical protein [Deltaproteobacteria bacterium]MBW2531184.1 hypothetical protein [Deltaproteobacteria bacterium]